MNHESIEGLLTKWHGILIAAKMRIDSKIDQFSNGRDTRIKRTEGRPVVFDLRTAMQQKDIQDQLCVELPQLANVIRSEPAIQGYNWKVGDYVELYLQHYQLVIQKVREAITNVNS